MTNKKKHVCTKVPPLSQNFLPFHWSPECQESFEKLKEALITTPVLSYLDYSKLFLLETDASLKGSGAILSQQDSEGNLHVVSFEKSMNNYSSAKLELLAHQYAKSLRIISSVQSLLYLWIIIP